MIRRSELFGTLGLLVFLLGVWLGSGFRPADDAPQFTSLPVPTATPRPPIRGAAVVYRPVQPTPLRGVVALNHNAHPDAARVPSVVSNDGLIAPSTPTVSINGIASDVFAPLPTDTINNLRMIYERGRQLGRDPNAFSKLGDSTIENPHFLTRFDDGPYDLGTYEHLQPIIDHYHGSFSRQGMAVRRGLHTWSVFDPLWADGSRCTAGETVFSCEVRLHNPSIMFIRLGSNDVGVPDSFDRNMRRLIEVCIENGIIPIIGTKADRREGASNQNNEMLRQIAVDYHVPLWDFDLVAGTLPGRGLGNDGVHLTTFYSHDYTQPEALRRGYGLQNLSALIALDQIWRVVAVQQ
jgi:hypothetical protein